MQRLLPILALSLAAVCWGLSFVATKVALEALPPFVLLFLRFSAATLFFAALILPKGMPRIARKDHLRILATSVVFPGCYFVCETYGVGLTTASKASLIIATVPVTVLLLSMLLLGERPGRRGIAGVALSLVGVGLLVGGRDSGILHGLELGDVLMLLAVLTSAIYMVVVAGLGKRISSVVITGLQMAYGALFFAPFFVVQSRGLDWAALTMRTWLAVGGLVAGATIAAFMAYNWALSKVPASRASVFINAVPVVTAVGAWLILSERLTPMQMLGGGLVVTAVTLTSSRPPAPKADAPEVIDAEPALAADMGAD